MPFQRSCQESSPLFAKLLYTPSPVELCSSSSPSAYVSLYFICSSVFVWPRWLQLAEVYAVCSSSSLYLIVSHSLLSTYRARSLSRIIHAPRTHASWPPTAGFISTSGIASGAGNRRGGKEQREREKTTLQPTTTEQQLVTGRVNPSINRSINSSIN